MTNVSLKFVVRLADHFSLDSQGPLFYRWMPSEQRAITLDLAPQARLRLWFDQVEHKRSGHEEHPKALTADTSVWGKVEAGPLRGILEMGSVSDNVLRVIADKKAGDPIYLQFGKSVVQDLLQPALSRFVRILRINFGQYWLRELLPWDSRTHTLGAYCQSVLSLEWSINDINWDPFIPNEHQLTFHVGSIGGGRQYLELIAEKDWAVLQEAATARYDPSEASLLLARAHELFDRGSHRHAFIEAVTALEVAIGELIARNLGATPPKEVEDFSSQLVKRQLVAVSATSGLLDASDLDAALKAITIRNEIAHDGKMYGAEKRNEFMGLLEVVSKIVGGVALKLPSPDGGNLAMPVKGWEDFESTLTK